MIENNKPKDEIGGVAPWMTTFADLSTLLLTFFILLLSFATMDLTKFQDAMGSIQKTLGFLPTGPGFFQHTMQPPIFKPIMESPQELEKNDCINNDNIHDREKVNEEIVKELEYLVKKLKLEDEVTIENVKRGVVLRVKSKLFFNLGEAELKKESYPILNKVAELMEKFSRSISIEGHTDNLPIAGGTYSSNWDLSANRALSALKFLKEKVEVDKINIAGFADNRPIASNDTEEGRAKNRRVEFVFYKE